MERIEYLDYMKGIAILVVVTGHVSQSLLGHHSFSDLIIIFEMPLFFTLSGFLANRTLSKSIIYNLSKKSLLLIPFFVIGSINALVRDNIYDFITQEIHNGYWFLLSLFCCWVLFIPLSKFAATYKLFRKYLILELVLLLLPFLLYKCISPYISSSINDVLSLSFTFTYYRFFVVGYFIGKLREESKIVKWLKGNPLLLECLCGVGGAIVFFFIILGLGYPELLQFVPMSITQLVLSSGLMYVIYIYYRHSTKFVKLCLSRFGRGSLTIYVLHFFLKPYIDISLISILSEFWIFIITVIVAMIISETCLVLAIPIETNPILRKYLLGKSK